MNFQLKPYSEIVFSVGNLAAAREVYTRHLGFEAVYEGAGHPSQCAFWRLPPSATTQETLLRFQNLGYGQLRLVQFGGVTPQYIRPGAQPWDTGGIFDIDLRVSDIDATFDTLLDLGWHGYSLPTEQTMGPFTVQEVLMQGPDGVVIAFVHRTNPPHPNPFDRQGVTSNVYLSAMMVRDLAVASAFFIKNLGFQSHNEIEFRAEAPGRSMFGLPHNLADQTTVKLHMLGPTETRDGLLDLVQLVGLTGEDFAARAQPPNRGVLMYRFPVKGLRAYHDFVVGTGVQPVCPLSRVVIEPYGEVSIFAVQSPDGAWMEFWEGV